MENNQNNSEDKEKSKENQIQSDLASSNQSPNVPNQQQILFKKPNERIKTKVNKFLIFY